MSLDLMNCGGSDIKEAGISFYWFNQLGSLYPRVNIVMVTDGEEVKNSYYVQNSTFSAISASGKYFKVEQKIDSSDGEIRVFVTILKACHIKVFYTNTYTQTSYINTDKDATVGEVLKYERGYFHQIIAT